LDGWYSQDEEIQGSGIVEDLDLRIYAEMTSGARVLQF
jgi:hypothetical protein